MDPDDQDARRLILCRLVWQSDLHCIGTSLPGIIREHCLLTADLDHVSVHASHLWRC